MELCRRGAVQEWLGERALIRIPAYMADAVTLHATMVEREVEELQRQKFPKFRALSTDIESCLQVDATPQLAFCCYCLLKPG